MRYMILLFMLLMSGVAEAQMNNYQQQNGYQPQNNYQQPQNSQANPMKRSLIKSSGDERKALNLLVLQEVATYKLGDEGLSDEIAGLQNNQEYYIRLEKIKSKLSNAKMTNSKNREVMQILNDAGNRLYNLLYN